MRFGRAGVTGADDRAATLAWFVVSLPNTTSLGGTLMALATSLAAAISRSSRCTRAAMATAAVLSLSAPALAVEQVYIWRDQSGVVRFSPVQDAERSERDGRVDSTVACERDGQHELTVTEATQRGEY
jgi:hypothetical protein